MVEGGGGGGVGLSREVYKQYIKISPDSVLVLCGSWGWGVTAQSALSVISIISHVIKEMRVL